MRASRRTVLLLAVGLFLVAGAARLATSSSPEEGRRPQVELAWFMTGLRDLCRSKDARLKLTPAQAKRILPELQALVDEGILIVDPQKLPTGRQGFGPGQQPPGGGLSEEEREQMRERRQKQAERIEKAIEKMEKALRQAQVDYILNLDFDPKRYGLAFVRPSGNQGGFNQADFEKWRKTMEEGQRRLVQLNKEVLDLVAKLAK
ncbi:MAG: hypothetical protein ACUVRM_06720 [Bacillota bacterium]